MKKLFLLFGMFLVSLGINAQSENNPVANPDAIVVSGNMRFTVLTPQLIRIEYSPTAEFEDRATFGVINRNLPVPSFTKEESDGYLYIRTDKVELKYKVGSVPSTTSSNANNLSVTLDVNGQKEIWYPGKQDNTNLKGTLRTLDGNFDDNVRNNLENGIVSRAGWAIVDESPATKRGDGSRTFPLDVTTDKIMPWVGTPKNMKNIDWYLYAYGHDYKTAIGDFTKIGGRIPMPPNYIFGYWYSRYWRYTAEQFRTLVQEIEENDIPIDVMIMDMDWHKSGWTGWSWDKSIIPNPKQLLTYFHRHDLQVALNLHPADGFQSYEDIYNDMATDMGIDPATGETVKWELDKYELYQAWAKHFLRVEEERGVDFWWLDWQQWLTNRNIDGLGETFWINHVLFNDQKLNRTTRPVIFHRWGGIGSHRYQIGFSGDTHVTFSTLAFQPWFTATASNVGYGYWGHDLGGHQQYYGNDPELYLRWMQYGVFSPIFRTHASSSAEIERRIWKFDNFSSLLKTVKMRQQMFPYIYTAARQTYDTGVSMCRPMYYEYPEAPEAYSFRDEYFFGDDILVSPVLVAAGTDSKAPKTTWLPEGIWWDVCRRHLVEGNCVITDYYDQEEIPLFMRAGSIIVNNPDQKNVKIRPERLIVKVYPGDNGKASLYEDEGNTQNYEIGAYTTTVMEQTASNSSTVLNIQARQGAFEGMPSERGYDIEFHGMTRPLSVKINGKAADSTAWSFNELEGVVFVAVEKQDCGQPISVVVEVDPNADKPIKSLPALTYDAEKKSIVAYLAPGYESATLTAIDPCGEQLTPVTVTKGTSMTLNIANNPVGNYKCTLYVDREMKQQTVTKE